MAWLLCTGVALAVGFASLDRDLWHDPYHDRNSHLLTGLNVALSLRALDPLGTLAAATAVTVWPPLHGLLLGVLFLIFGFDPIVGSVPCLLGWSVTVGFAFLLGRGPPGSAFGGAVAALLALASPAWRLLGSDVMLEGLGAALSGVVLCAFILSQEAAAGGRGDAALRWTRGLAIGLTALFLEKFNYWLMALCGIGLTWVLADRGRCLRAFVQDRAVRRVALAALIHPGTLLGVAVAVASIAVPSPIPLHLGGRLFSIPRADLLTLGPALIVLTWCWIWRRERFRLAPAIGPRGLALLRGHAFPVGLWFMVPGVAGDFVWFVGPTHFGASRGYDPLAAAASQWHGFAHGFHAGPWVATLVAGSALIGAAAAIRRGGPRCCIPIFAAVGALLVVLHPQQQWRFQATWLFAVWICAGWGLHAVGCWALALAERWGVPPMLAIRRGVAGAALGALALALFPADTAAPIALQVAIRTPQAPDDRALAARWLSMLDGRDEVGFVSTEAPTDLFAWSVRMGCRCRRAIDQPWFEDEPTRDAVRTAASAWLQATSARWIVVLSAPPAGQLPGAEGRSARMMGVGDSLAAQTRFVLLTPPGLNVDDRRVTTYRLAAGEPLRSHPTRHYLALWLWLLLAATALIVVIWPGGAVDGERGPNLPERG